MDEDDNEEEQLEEEEQDGQPEGPPSKGGGSVSSSGSATRIRQAVLILPSRGVTTRPQHLVKEIESLLPHSKKESKHGPPSSTCSQMSGFEHARVVDHAGMPIIPVEYMRETEIFLIFLVLLKMRETTEAYSGGTVNDAVISCPRTV
ncbi:Hsp70 chaperone [Tilletia horrida]|nr:Hsp70 chaperone [Tilletia horrida]